MMSRAKIISHKESKMKPIVIILLSLALAACSACNRKPAPQSVNVGQATVTVEGDKVTTKTKDPSGKMIIVITQHTQPDNYPKDIPVLTDGEESTYSSTLEAGHITLQTFSPKGTRELADYFEHQLSSS